MFIPSDIIFFSNFIIDLYEGQFDSSSLLYSETEDTGMSSFWSEYVQFNGFNLESYSGDFPDILNLLLKVSHRREFLYLALPCSFPKNS